MNELAAFLYEAGQLKRVRRSGWWLAGVRDPESVAEHSFRTAVIGFVLAHLEGADAGRVTIGCVFHDLCETRINDQHRLGRRYVDWTPVEHASRDAQLETLPTPMRAALTDILTTADAKEARIARDADLLECLLQAREYQVTGAASAETWVRNCYAALQTESERRLADACIAMDPVAW